MHQKIRAFLSKRQNQLKVANQVAVFEKDKVKVIGLDFLYEMQVEGANINPPVCVDLQDFTFASSLLGKFEVTQQLPKSLIVQARNISLSLRTREEVYSVIANQLTQAEYLGIEDKFTKGLEIVYRYFQPETIYFANPTSVVLGSSGWRYVAKISMADEPLPETVCGTWGSVSEDFILIPTAKVSWEKVPDSWHLIAAQRLEYEEFRIIFSALTEADISAVAEISKLADSLVSDQWFMPVPELLKILKYDFDTAVVDKDEIRVVGPSFECKIKDAAETYEVLTITPAIAEFILNCRDKVYFKRNEEKTYLYTQDQHVKVITTA